MIRVVIIISFLLCIIPAFSQRITLQQAIDSARARSIDIRQNTLLADAAYVNWRQAKASQLPNLNASANHGTNQGRSIDPFTNSYVNQSVNYAGYGLNSGVVLFNGMGIQNNIRQNAALHEAAKYDLQHAKDNVVLNVILAYLQVLNNDDQLQAATTQASLSQKQLERLEIMDKQGAINPSLVSDMRGQLMNDQLTISTLQNELQLSKLALSQLMMIPYTKTMELERVSVDELMNIYNGGSEEVYRSALLQLPLVKAAELRKQAAMYAVKAAKGELYPAVTLGGSVQTNYSSVAQSGSGKIPYGEQVKNNIFSSLNLGLRIPVFNARQVRSRIKLAEIDVQSTELIQENTRLQLKQQVEQAHLQMTNAFERYKLLQDQVKAFEQSFRAAEARFTAGVGTSVDYFLAKNNLDRARINLISAQYDFILRKKILDYYNGK